MLHHWTVSATRNSIHAANRMITSLVNGYLVRDGSSEEQLAHFERCTEQVEKSPSCRF